ncbi:AzlC family ABC transporter permease [Halomonas sp. ISL-60]|uniref:AzlC family ABC transporter permease n=1 Tax=Halomonas sp. ISL-56 TaxID=2819149 RepID=UPI001BE92835|nr:AzlC family ABC transporter permease [Halomonas sp. ISL-56]MBT2771051.1 AzlC family ABC transporter permease [Halomonas sp. ISL-60]MBT2801944.1 AzlC family ABC transporter permease [Halomonas sp. ISL-56]
MRECFNVAKPNPTSNEAEKPGLTANITTAIFAIAPVSMLFGFTAYKAGWSIGEIFLVSLLGFSGSGQFAALPLSDSGATFLTILFVCIMINSRYFAISLSCSKKLPTNKLLKVFSSHALGDEAYAIEQGHSQRTMLIIRFTIFVCWIVFGVTGGIIAGLFPNLLPDGINASIPASLMLLFLAISYLKNRPYKSGLITVPKVILGFIISGFLYYTLGAVYFWIPSIVLLSAIYYLLKSRY